MQLGALGFALAGVGCVAARGFFVAPECLVFRPYGAGDWPCAFGLLAFGARQLLNELLAFTPATRSTWLYSAGVGQDALGAPTFGD